MYSCDQIISELKTEMIFSIALILNLYHVTHVLSQISSRERGVIKRSRHSSGRSLSEEEPAQTLLEECWLDGQEILEREQHIKKIEVSVLRRSLSSF